ncbi:chitin deacetylase [Gongronella butleri]|nr:chitin deacetylase [Gongronella butleri]
MYFKSIAASIALMQTLVSAGAPYYASFNSSIDPNSVTIPSIPQTTSYDPATECQYYTPTGVTFNPKEWPTSWLTATSNGMTKTAEFIALNKSIPWTQAPNIQIRKKKADGSLDFTGYNQAADPDCWWSASGCTKPKNKGVNADIYQCPEPETWGLTYDDGPNCSHNAFYDFLEQKSLKATMFYIGSNVMDWPYGAMRGIKDGHHIADHTWSHQLMTTLTNEEVLAELYYTQKAIKMTTGVTPKHWRPAYGDVDDRVRWIATQLNMTTILWNLDTDDWAAGTTETVAQVQAAYDSFIQMGSNGTYATTGNIVLTHEIDNQTMQMAVENLPKIQAAYKHVVDVATCMNITYPYMETTVKFPSFSDYLSGNTNTSTGSSSAGAGSGASASTNGSKTSGAIKVGASSNSILGGLAALAFVVSFF